MGTFALRLGTVAIAGSILSSCLPLVPKSNSDTSTSTSSTESSAGSKSTSLNFSGATSATNLDGTRIAIAWTTGTDPKIQSYLVYESTVAGDLTPLGRTGPTIGQFVHAGLSNGSLHYYIVRAFDADGNNDGNNNLVGTVTYSGITNAVTTGTTTATVTFPSASQAAELHIYGSARGGASTLLATVAGTATSANLTGLNSGTTYSFSVKASTPQGTEDANTLTKSTQTISDTSTKYQGVMAVKAYGASPTAPAAPTQRQVSITWLPFTGASTTTSYALIRTLKGAAMDSTVTQTCTASTVTSCQVCTATGATPKTCTDTQVAASPTQYDYTVVLLKNGVPEELPANDTSYRVTVAIPPDNMVLVQRDAANYEMCQQQLKKTTDPLNHQRCAYSGLGDRPYNTGPNNGPLNLDAGYYDFGYNLFIDRFESGCKWTRSACTGFGQSNGDCWGTSIPSNTAGADGTVFYMPAGGSCYVKYAGTWYGPASTSIPISYRASALANAPGVGAKYGPMTNVGSDGSALLCQATIDPDYGAKRLMRRREFVAAAAWPTMNGEPGALTDSQILTLQGGSANYTTIFGCNSNGHLGVTTGVNFNGTGYELAGITAASNPDSFVIGSNATHDCVSRFGAQDLIGNVSEAVSDGLGSCSSTTHTCLGTTSTYDSGNTDLSTVSFDGVMAPGGGASSVTNLVLGGSAPQFGTTKFLPTLGLPAIAMSGAMTLGNGLTQFLPAKLFTNIFILNSDSSNGTTMARSAASGSDWFGYNNAGRWALTFARPPSNTGGWSYGMRCAVSAE